MAAAARGGRRGGQGFLLLKFAGIVLAIFNAFVHSRDAYAVMPAGLWLSIATVLLLALGEALLAVSAEEVAHG